MQFELEAVDGTIGEAVKVLYQRSDGARSFGESLPTNILFVKHFWVSRRK